MIGWKKARLEDCCRSISDGDHLPPPKTDSGIPFVTISDIHNNRFDLSKTRFVPEAYYEAIDQKRKIQKGDVLYSVVGSYGIPVFADESLKVAFQRHIAILRPSEEIEPRFLYYSMLNRDFFLKADAVAVGAAQKTITLAALRGLEIALPPLPIQRRIAAILSDYDSAIDNARRQIALLEEAAMRLYREWFGDGRQEKVLLVDVASVTYGFPFVGKLFNDKGLGLPIIRIRNVPEGLSKDFTTEKAPDRYIVKDGDILIGMDGEFYVNFWSGGDAYLVQRTCRLRPNDAHMFGFVLEAIKGPIRAFQSAIVGSTVGHLGKKDIDTISIPIPKDKKIVDLLQDGFEQRLTLMKQICSLTEARDRLLPKLMSGEIEV